MTCANRYNGSRIVTSASTIQVGKLTRIAFRASIICEGRVTVLTNHGYDGVILPQTCVLRRTSCLRSVHMLNANYPWMSDDSSPICCDQRTHDWPDQKSSNLASVSHCFWTRLILLRCAHMLVQGFNMFHGRSSGLLERASDALVSGAVTWPSHECCVSRPLSATEHIWRQICILYVEIAS